MGQFGQSTRRTEDKRFLTGRGRYTDDLNRPRQLHAHVLRSPHAHARIKRIDTASASQAPGVALVFTGADLAADGIGGVPCPLPLKSRDGSPLVAPPRPALAADKVRHMGEAVACVIAETAAAAREATELIEVDYEDLPAVTDPRAAIVKGVPAVWDEARNNVILDWEKGDKAACDAAFAAAAHRVSFDLVNNRVISNPMEPRAAIAEWEAGEERFVLTTSTQGSHGLKRVLADNVFKVPHNKVRVVTPDVGGAFGTKITVYPEHVMALYAARRLNRPVKWVADRIETFVSDLHGRDNLTHAEMALDKDGKVLALRVNTLANMGAHVAPFNPFITTDGGTSMLSGVYDIPSIRIEVKCVLTNTVPVDAYRGAGRPEAIYVVERLMDVAARKMGVDAAELRRRNAIPPSALPYKTQTGMVYDSGKYAGIMAQAMERAGWKGFPARKKESAARGKIRGIGLANYIEVCGRGLDERAEIRFDPSGDVTLFLGTQTNGQGHETTYAQMLSDEIGVPFERIRVVQGDTDLISHGRGTGGSRSLCVGGSAVLRAAERVVEKGKKIAAHVLEAAEADVAFTDGAYRIAGTDRSITVTEVAKAAFAAKSVPQGVEMGLDEVAHYQPDAPTFPNGCHICEVEIDPDTGVVEVLSYTVVDDFGRVVNPMVVEGQVHGGVAQGLGQALLEDAHFDPESAQLLSGSFMDYCMPRADDMPNIDFTYDESSPCVTNPVGAKGCGEAGSVGAPPALISAITNALADRGVTHVDMPVTRERMWRLLNGAA